MGRRVLTEAQRQERRAQWQARNELVRLSVEANEPHVDLAAKLGVTRERARQLSLRYREANPETRKPVRWKPKRTAAEQRVERILVRGQGRENNVEIAAAERCSAGFVSDVLRGVAYATFRPDLKRREEPVDLQSQCEATRQSIYRLLDEDKSPSRIARLLGVPLMTVRSHMGLLCRGGYRWRRKCPCCLTVHALGHTAECSVGRWLARGRYRFGGSQKPIGAVLYAIKAGKSRPADIAEFTGMTKSSASVSLGFHKRAKRCEQIEYGFWGLTEKGERYLALLGGGMMRLGVYRKERYLRSSDAQKPRGKIGRQGEMTMGGGG